MTRAIEEKVSKLFEHQSEVESLTHAIEEKDSELFERESEVEELKNSVQDIDGRYHESSILFSSLKAKREQDNRNSVLTTLL